MRFLENILCLIGRHRFDNSWQGLLYRRCERCGKIVQVATPYNYRPSRTDEKEVR